MRRLRLCICLLALALVAPGRAAADISERQDVRAFMQYMHEAHGFSLAELRQYFTQTQIIERILRLISRPAEKKPWYQYRSIFLGARRIEQGAQFWQQHRETLARAEQDYGVPPEIIVSIIGVETHYGENTGAHRVIDALSTLAFAYPRRSAFFRAELEHYLLLCRQQGLQPTRLLGSYAGAMGLPQFISSSYRSYAVDFDGDGKADIWTSTSDAIGSVANYFQQHGWQTGAAVSVPVQARDGGYKNLLSQDLGLQVSFSELARHGVHSDHVLAADTPVRLVELRARDGVELWLALHNFYVITRYNHSALYAMAVYQLSQAISQRYLAARSL